MALRPNTIQLTLTPEEANELANIIDVYCGKLADAVRLQGFHGKAWDNAVTRTRRARQIQVRLKGAAEMIEKGKAAGKLAKKVSRVKQARMRVYEVV